MKLTPFDTCMMYLALKSHFSGSYDYIKYCGKVKLTPDQFEKRRDRYQFARLSRVVSGEEMQDYMVAQFLNGAKWVGEFLDPKAREAHLQYQKRKQNFSYMFNEEVSGLFQSVENPQEVFQEGHNYPPILMRAFDGSLCIQYFAILMHYFKFENKFDQMLGDDFLWPDYRTRAKKLFPLLVFDDQLARKIIKANLSIEKSA